jgi:hypothetical protein
MPNRSVRLPDRETVTPDTVSILREQYGPRVIIPLDRVMEDYFPGLSQEHLLRLGVPVVRIFDSTEAPLGVGFVDLAEHLDRRNGTPPRNDNEQEPAPSGFVYLIGFDNWVKIGYTAKSVKQRMDGLQTAIPIKLQLINSMPGTMRLEANLHQRFAEYRRQGEWFVREGELEAWIMAGCRDAGEAS